jgi:hypothetical protein
MCKSSNQPIPGILMTKIIVFASKTMKLPDPAPFKRVE